MTDNSDGKIFDFFGREITEENRLDQVKICIDVSGGKMKGRDARYWKGLLTCKGRYKKLDGRYPYITRPRAYLATAVALLEALKHRCSVEFSSDSGYLCRDTSERLAYWSDNNWHKDLGYGDKILVPNKDLWEEIFELSKKHKIKWIGTPASKIQERMEYYRLKQEHSSASKHHRKYRYG